MPTKFKKVVKAKTAAKSKKPVKAKSVIKKTTKKKVSKVSASKTSVSKKAPAKKAAAKKTPAKKAAAKKVAAKKAPAKKAVKTTSKKKETKIKIDIKKQTKKTGEKVTKTKVKQKVSKVLATSQVAKKKINTPPKKVQKIETPKKAPKRSAKVEVFDAMQSASVAVVSQILGLAGIKPYQPKKNEEYMGEEMQVHFRKILQAWKLQLMEEVDRTVHHMKDEAANFPDPSDRATQEEEFNLELRTRDRERKLIKKIEGSLNLITDGSYGYCDACDVEIGLRRLEARPTANLCIDCKTLDEIREKQQGN